MQSLLAELKRRSVIRVGGAYLIAAWVLAQVADLGLESFGAPAWAMKTILLGLLIGFPLALIFAWVFELTPEGIKRDSEVDSSATDTSLVRRQLDRFIIVVLFVAVAYFALDRWVLNSRPESVAVADATVNLDKSIAVLPFENRSSRSEDSHFVDGIQDDILTQLSKLSGLDKVISRTSVERYRDTTETMPEIGKTLGVAAILEGGVQRSGTTVRITVQLIEAASDKHLWSETFDRELTAENLFAVQSQISSEIARLLNVVMTGEDRSQINRLPTGNLDAYNQFVLGREALRERTGKSIRAGLAHFRKAVELDSEYAQAHVGVAESLELLPEYGGVPHASIIVEFRAEIDRALQLDPTLGEAYAVSASSKMQSAGYTEAAEDAEAEFLRAIQLSPNYPRSYHWYSLLLLNQGRQDEALVMIQKARALDPEDPTIVTVAGGILYSQGDLDQAQTMFLQGVAKNPEYPGHYGGLGMVLASRGDLGVSATLFQRAHELNPENSNYKQNFCFALYRLDDVDLQKGCPAEDDDSNPGRQLTLLMTQGKFHDAAEFATNLESASSDVNLRFNQVYALLLNADWQAAKELQQAVAPAMYQPGPATLETDSDLWDLLFAATTLRDEDGWTDQALERADQVLQNLSLERIYGEFISWWAHGIRGDLADVITQAHHSPTWSSALYTQYTAFSSPLFQQYFDLGPDGNAFVANFKATEQHRQWYRDHQGKPFNLDDYQIKN